LEGRALRFTATEDKVVVWSWWWNELRKESLADSPDEVIWKQILRIEKAKISGFPRAR
jgi:hypothetical protein